MFLNFRVNFFDIDSDEGCNTFYFILSDDYKLLKMSCNDHLLDFIYEDLSVFMFKDERYEESDISYLILINNSN